MHKMSLGEVLAIGLMMFSIFFGAGNLIFPPALGQAAGDHTLVAMLGFLTTGVGLPLLGIAAIALQGGKYIEFIRRVTHPAFATGVLVILYLTIGPLFAMPRTGAVSFEIGIRPFLSADSVGVGQFIYTAAFFGLSYYLARNPSQLIDRVGNPLSRRWAMSWRPRAITSRRPTRRAFRMAIRPWICWPPSPSARWS